MARNIYRKRVSQKTIQRVCEPLEDRRLLTFVISEFMADNETTLADKDGDFSDWIEIRNTGPTAGNLNGWYLTDRSDDLTKWTFPDTPVGPNEHLVIFASEKNERRSGAELHTNFKLSNNGEYLALIQADGTTIASQFSPEYPAQSDDVSYGLSSDLSLTGFFASPTPGSLNQVEPIPDGSGAVVINELMYKLPRAELIDAENIEEEFIELHNRGTESIDVTNWQFTRGVTFTLPESSIPAGGYLVVAADVAAFQAKYPGVENVVGGWTGKLSNDGETIELVDAIGTTIDQVRYASNGDWSTRAAGPVDRGHTGWIWTEPHDGGGHSLELIHSAMPNEIGQNWNSSADAGGSPGVANSAAANDVAPFISDVIHSPAVPRASDEVTVTARILDNRPGESANLHWRVDARNNFNTVSMVDDGTQGDQIAGDGVYSAVIPAHDDRTVIEFFVESVDAANNTRTWPAPTADGQQVVNALYQVIDEFNYDVWNPNSAPIYFQVMTNAERNEFTNINRQSDAQFNTTFIAVSGTDIDVRYNTGVRIRGSGSRGNAVPNNRITFPNDREWQGITRINVNAQAPVNQISAAALFRLAGVETADAHAVKMYSNGVDLRNGHYAHLEVLDSDYAERHYPNDSEGNVYRGRRVNESPPGGENAGLRYRGPESLPYVSYVKNTNASEADWSDIIEMTNILDNGPAETFVEDIQGVANIDQWFRAFAMNSLIGNTEFGLFTGDAAGDDYAMYRGAIDARFNMLPYDMDSVYGGLERELYQPRGVPGLRRVIDHPEFRYRYNAQYLDLMDNILLTDRAEEVIRASVGNITSETQIQQILSYLSNRAQYVRDRITEQITVSVDTESVNGYPRITDAIATLSGQGLEASSISMTINDVPVNSLAANRNWSHNVGGSISTIVETLSARESVWSYLDDGSDQGTAWRHTFFDDSTWKSGQAELGYNEGDENTLIEDGDPGNGVAATTYFRRKFDMTTHPSEFDSFRIHLKYDDAAAVFINGVEVVRSANLEQNAAFDDFATSNRGRNVENTFETFSVPSHVFVLGENTVAVEVHQGGPSSSDVSFDLEVEGIKTERVEDNVDTATGLFPGLNRYTLRSYDGPNGTGNLESEQIIDVWYDTGSETVVSNDISADTTWTRDSGPYIVNSNVTVAADAVLTIEPGTSVFFGDNGRLTVNGQLVAIGSPYQEIRFSRNPAIGENWEGIQFENSMSDNRIEHAIIEYGVTGDGMIGLERSSLSLDHVVLDHTDRRRIRTINSSLVVRNSEFTNIFDPGVRPTTDNQSEHIWGRGIPADGQFILENNSFGHITGHNDSIDFDAPKLPNPIPIIRNNTFAGGGDDALDMTGDVWVEGNSFQNFIKDQFNVDPGESNTISASEGTFWVIRNTFENVQHASLVKENAFMYFQNNTVNNSSFAPLYFDLPGQTDGPGRGAVVEDSLFANVPVTFDFVLPSTELSVSHSILSEADRFVVAGTGFENIFGDPHVGGIGEDFALRDGSFALGSGTYGQDRGARINGGALVSGVPTGTTSAQSATLRVGGPSITDYKFRIGDGPFGDEISVDTPIRLTGLTDGQVTVEVIGKNAIGIWQPESEATSVGWTVDRDASFPIQLSEVLASNRSIDIGGTNFDAVELFNPNSGAVDISGYSLTDNPLQPRKFVFPAGTPIQPGGYIALRADVDSDLGFALNDKGETVYLYDDSAEPVLVDSITYGLQLPDLSISRTGTDGSWSLSVPTLGTENVAHPAASPHNVLINEWYTDGDIRVEDDFIELYNTSVHPANIGGSFLTDFPFAIPNRSEIAPLSFVPAGGFEAFTANGRPQDGNDHVDFRLSPELEMIGLFDADLDPIDVVFSYSQTSEISRGRVPDASNTFDFLSVPTPGATNGSSEKMEFGFSWNELWSYEASGQDQGTAWREPDFDDADWPTGPGPLGNERESLAEPIQTEFELGDITYYFRREFELPAGIDISQMDATINTQVDDGFIVYLNGLEVVRRGMPNGEVPFDQFASRNVNEAQVEGPFTVPNNLFVEGTNVFAVEVHQVRIDSSDLVMGLAFNGEVAIANATDLSQIDSGLRISEVMYNPAEDGQLDFIEVTNISDSPINLAGVRLSDGIDFEFPPIMLAPNEFAVVAEDTDDFLNRYGSGANLVGQFSGRLSNNNDQIALQFPNPFDAAVMRFEYSDAWYPETNGQGKSLEFSDLTMRRDQWQLQENWQASSIVGGTPGYASDAEAPSAPRVVINEVLTHTDLPLVDAIEIYNASDETVDLSGWFLSDSLSNPAKFEIPVLTILPPGAYVVFDENDFNASLGVEPNDFALSSAHGETLSLWSSDDSGPKHIIDVANFGAAANGESFGRYPNGTGSLLPMQHRTLGTTNSDPRIGPVTISEVNYHPSDPSAAALAIDPNIIDDDLEFIEIHNPTAQTIDLTSWRLRKGADFDFASGTSLLPGGAIVVVSFDVSDPANSNLLRAFRAHYGIDDATRLVGPFKGILDNGEDTVQLQRPDDPPLEEPNFIPRLFEDEVSYDDQTPWPTSADGQGNSLHRVLPAFVGDLATQWVASSPTPGSVVGSEIAGDFNNDSLVDIQDIDLLCQAVRNGNNSFDLDGNGVINSDDIIVMIETILDSDIGDSNLDGIFNSRDFVTVFAAGEFEDAIAGNSTWIDGDWNCDGDFTTRDLVFAFSRGNYSNEATPIPMRDTAMFAAAIDGAFADMDTDDAKKSSRRR